MNTLPYRDRLREVRYITTNIPSARQSCSLPRDLNQAIKNNGSLQKKIAALMIYFKYESSQISNKLVQHDLSTNRLRKQGFKHETVFNQRDKDLIREKQESNPELKIRVNQLRMETSEYVVVNSIDKCKDQQLNFPTLKYSDKHEPVPKDSKLGNILQPSESTKKSSKSLKNIEKLEQDLALKDQQILELRSKERQLISSLKEAEKINIDKEAQFNLTLRNLKIEIKQLSNLNHLNKLSELQAEIKNKQLSQQIQEKDKQIQRLKGLFMNNKTCAKQ